MESTNKQTVTAGTHCAHENHANDMIFTAVPTQWEHFLPLGNGRLGAMVKTHPCNEVLQLNEEGIWSGGYADRANGDAKKYLPRIRELVKQGNVLQAQELAFRTLSGTSPNERAYQTAGEVRIDFFSPAHTGIECGFPLQHTFSPKCTETYRAVLSLDTAAVTVTYTDENDVTFTRKTWISAKDDMIFMHVTANKQNAVNFSLYVDRGMWVDSIFAHDGFVFLEDSHGIPFCLGVGAVSEGGTIETKGAMLTGDTCSEVLFFTDIRPWKYGTKGFNGKAATFTAPRGGNTACAENARKTAWFKSVYKNLLHFRGSVLCRLTNESASLRTVTDSLFARHIEEYRPYRNAMSLYIGEDSAAKENSNTKIAHDATKNAETAFGGKDSGNGASANRNTETLSVPLSPTPAAPNGHASSRKPHDSAPFVADSPSFADSPFDADSPLNADSPSFADSPTVAALLESIAPNNTRIVNLYAAFSRYLLIAGSRAPGILPLTLQGLWNGYIDPPWGSKYTININAQMNYWPVNMTSLSSLETPLFNLLERAYPNGTHVARTMYGCRGFVMHHNTDYWGDSAPQDYWIPGTYWVLGAAWLATHIWEHYEYTQNKAQLCKYYYLLHEACLFFVDFLQETDAVAADGKPYLVINPSVSPENSYVTKTGQVGAFCEGCQMDNMILREAFTDCLKASTVLGKRCVNKKGARYGANDFADFEYVLSHLKAPELNKDGSLTEWNREVTEVEPGHRHISHLYGLFPGHSIDPANAALKNAAIKTLENRLRNGGGHTGWSQAWIINFWVSLGEKEKALDGLVKILKNSTLPNLFDNHPPFQIDGNFGTLTGICRMLVQSSIAENGDIHVKLLPCLPNEDAWQNGHVRGMGIKGGYSVSFDWKNGKPTNVSFVANEYANKDAKIVVDG